MARENHKVLEIVRETLDESIMDLSLAYEILKRLEGMGIITIRDFRDYEFSKDEIQSVLNTQKHLKLIFWERDWNNIEAVEKEVKKSKIAPQIVNQVMGQFELETSVKERVIADYQITVIKVQLDDIVKQQYENKLKTEKQQFNTLTCEVNKLMRDDGNTMFLRLARMRLIQKSLSKLNKTKQLLKKYKNERVLVFCGEKIADALGIPSHHSKSKDKDAFKNFTEGEGKQMAVVKIGNTGITFKPLNKVIINYFDSNSENLAQKINRCMAMEYDTPNKKADIYIICSTEKVEEKWLNKALEFFDKNKVRYI